MEVRVQSTIVFCQLQGLQATGDLSTLLERQKTSEESHAQESGRMSTAQSQHSTEGQEGGSGSALGGSRRRSAARKLPATRGRRSRALLKQAPSAADRKNQAATNSSREVVMVDDSIVEPENIIHQ